jgi:hypothetical protein
MPSTRTSLRTGLRLRAHQLARLPVRAHAGTRASSTAPRGTARTLLASSDTHLTAAHSALSDSINQVVERHCIPPP